MEQDFSGPWPAPAKLNLMLRVVGRRPDGYHALQTVFQFIDHGDLLYFRLRDDDRVRRLGENGEVPEDMDLVVRAARLLRTWVGARPLPGVDIRLDKRLPMGGGLGGGSSDAATVLRVLNRLWQLDLSEDVLAEIGLRLGADVPVFVRGSAAWGEGVGECLTPVDLPEAWYLVLIPPCQVSTGEIFRAGELTRNSPQIKITDFLAGDTRNDCLPVVRGRYPPVAEALDWLGRHGDARLTGTGACVFAAYAREAEARRVLEQVPGTLRGFVARGRNRSPLLARLDG